jgi:hypothetical protein
MNSMSKAAVHEGRSVERKLLGITVGYRKVGTININLDTYTNLITWNSGNLQTNALLLLHELGHAVDWFHGDNASTLMDDALPDGEPDPIAETNNAMALAGCK